MSEPMDNNKQAVDITGYRVLSQEEKDWMNILKDSERVMMEQLEFVRNNVVGVNQRSLALAKTELQTAFMWAIRAIARPNGE